MDLIFASAGQAGIIFSCPPANRIEHNSAVANQIPTTAG